MDPADSPPPSLLIFAPPSECGLLDWLRPQVSRLMLEEISKNDYGKSSEAYCAAILEQLGPQPSLGLLPRDPRGVREVLELECWNEPDRNPAGQPPSNLRGHLKRLLACTILLRNVAYVKAGQRRSEEEFFIETSATTVIQLVRRSMALGHGAVPLAAGFLLWLYGRQAHPAIRPFTAFAVLLLQALSRLDEPSSRGLLQTCAWVEHEERRARELLAADAESPRWLIGLNGHADRKGDRERWVRLATEALSNPPAEYAAEVRAALRAVANRIAGRPA